MPIGDITTVALASELPTCNPSRRGAVYYVEAEDAFYFCDGSEVRWVDLSGQRGEPGTSWMTATAPADAAACPSGGIVVLAGPDSDADGVLDAAEIVSSTPVCHGAQGPSGAPGADGQDGRTPLIEADAAATEDCPRGGVVLSIGFDANADGMLAADERLVAQTICDGEDGAAALIVTQDARPDQCAAGGFIAQVGVDANDDGALGDQEIDDERLVCNGEPGRVGRSSLIATDAASAAQCSAGGLVVRVGVDDDEDGVLDDAEVDSTDVVCSTVAPPACTAPLADCNGDPTDGCETDLSSDPLSCGGCANACPVAGDVEPQCIASRCALACDAGFADCDHVAANGCEVDLRSDIDHCGACGSLCGERWSHAEEACLDGECVLDHCDPGRGDCNSQLADGCETDVLTHPDHCGSCGARCDLENATAACASGACAIGACDAGFDDCDGLASTGCELDFTPPGATCAGAPYLGAAEGDEACGFGCPSNPYDGAPFATSTGTSSAWFEAVIREDSSCLTDLSHRIELQVPAGVDYDLLVYTACDTPAVARSEGFDDESVVLMVSDQIATSESQSYWIEVRYVGGHACVPWTLNVFGRNCE